LLDSGTPYYDTYECADGKWVAVGAIEPQFYAELLAGLGLASEVLPEQNDRSGWPHLRARFTQIFRSEDRDYWAELFADTDACLTPVLSFDEVADNAHLAARETIIELDGITQGAPAPRFSRTAPVRPRPPVVEESNAHDILSEWACTADACSVDGLVPNDA
jgi:alpha-methylacyl-CoA racemase